MKPNNAGISIFAGIALIAALFTYSGMPTLGKAFADGTTLSPVAFLPFIASNFDGIPTLTPIPTPTLTPTPVVPRADLIVTSLAYTETFTYYGKPVHFQMTVKNQGDAAAENFDVAWNPLGADHTGDWITVASDVDLSSNEDKTIYWTHTWYAVAEYTTVGMADYGDKIAESDETNNTAERNVSVDDDF